MDHYPLLGKGKAGWSRLPSYAPVVRQLLDEVYGDATATFQVLEACSHFKSDALENKARDDRKVLEKVRGKKAGDGEISPKELEKQMQKELDGPGEKLVDDTEAEFELAIDTHQAGWMPTDEVLINMDPFSECFEKECLLTFRSLRAPSVSTQNGNQTASDGIVAWKEYESFLLFLGSVRGKDNHQLILWTQVHAMAEIPQGRKIAKRALFLGASLSKTNSQGYMRNAAPGFAETQRALSVCLHTER